MSRKAASKRTRLLLHDEEADNVQPHRPIGKPTHPLQAPYGASQDAEDGEDDKAGNVADGSIRKLANDLAATENQDGNSHELLERLRNVDEVSRLFAKDAEERVTVAQNGITRGVKGQEDFPQDEAAEAGGDGEDNVQGDTGAVSDLGEGISEGGRKPC